ncbi:MAG TPA: hypothetical protein VGG63_16400 [Steroidobacteraceae bacterium]|jgi:hypothetical protein
MSAHWQTLVANVYDREQHRPQSRDEMRVAAWELRQRGLTVEDIGSALRLSEGAVRELLEVVA